MALDTLKWLTDELGFTADEAKELAPKFTEDRAGKIEKGYLRQSDYSRSMNDIQKAKDAVAAAETKLNGEMAEWAQLTAEEKSQAGDLKAKLDASEAKVFGLTQKLTRVAEEAGIDPKTVLDGEPPKEPKKVEPQAFDPKPLHEQIGGVAQYMMTLSADLPYIAQQHFELTGERLDTRAFIAGIKDDIASGKKGAVMDPVQRWEAQYQIPEKREAAGKAKYDADIKAAEDRGRTAALSEAALPNTGVRQGTHSPVFRTTNVSKGSILQRPQPSQRLAGAAGALATGKYRGDGQKTA